MRERIIFACPMIRQLMWRISWSLVCLAFVGLVSPIVWGQDDHDEYRLAAGYYERQEYQEAIEKFRELILHQPNTYHAAMSYFYLGESHVQLGDFRSAFPAYQVFLKRLPEDGLFRRARYRLGECAFHMRWDAQATGLLEDFIENHATPGDELVEQALFFLGETRLRRQEPQLALQVFERAMHTFRNSGNSARYRFGLARAMQALKRTDEALRFYELLSADNEGPYYGLARMHIGIIHFERSQFELAQQEFQVAIQRLAGEPGFVEARYWCAKTEMALSNYQAAYEQIAAAIPVVDDNDLKMALLMDGALAAAKVQQTDSALSWLTMLLKTWPDTHWADDALQLQIELFYHQQRYDETRQAIEQFLVEFEGHPNTSTILEYLGRIQYDQRQFRHSLSTFQELLDQAGQTDAESSKRPVWLYFKALSQVSLRQYESAMETLSQIDTDQQDSQFAASVWLAKSSSVIGLGQYEQAIVLLKDFLQKYPTASAHLRARSDLTLAYAKTDRWDLAEQELRRLCDDTADHEERSPTLETTLLLGELALLDLRYELAQWCFKQLSAVSNPRRFVMQGLSGLAWIQVNQGDLKSSIPIFERLVAEYAETELAAEAAMACGKYFEQQKQFSHAAEMYSYIQQKYGESPYAELARLREAFSLFKLGGDSNLKQAESMLSKPTRTDSPLADEMDYQLAWIYLETDRTEQAMPCLQNIIDSHPGSRYWDDSVFRVAQHAMAGGDLELSGQLIDKLQGRTLDRVLQTRVDFLNGQLGVAQEDWPSVEWAMQQVLQATDDEILRKKARYWLAESLFQQQDYQRARLEFNRLADDSQRISKQRQAWIQLRMAQCSAHQEDWSTALQLAQAAKHQHSDFEAAHELDFVIGRAHAAQGRLSQARNAFQQVVESARGASTVTAAMAQWQIGETYFHQQDYQSAIEAFYQVDSLYAYETWRAAALIEAGKCHEHLGNWSHAVRLYRQLIEKYPQSEFYLAAEQRLNLATRQAHRQEHKNQK